MGRRISKEFLHPSILEGVNNKIGNLDSLETDAKGNMVQAINELVEKLDNSAEIESGKELIASAIGNPLITGKSTFDAMSEAILALRRESENETDAREVLYNMMIEDGYTEANSEMTVDELIDLLDRSGIEIGDVKQIACGDNHTFILKNDGSLYSCGYNNHGQLGLGSTAKKDMFTQVTTNINNDVKEVVCGEAYTFILKNDGSVWACGSNTNGQLGLGTGGAGYYNTTFTQVTKNINNDVKQVACGTYHTFILKNDGTVWSCGFNYNGQLGLGNTNTYYKFTQVTTNINNDVKQISCDGQHTFILKNDGSLWATGDNYYGNLGLNDTTERTTFTQVTENINNDVKQIACGSSHTVILKNDGSVWSCGWNTNGQLGLGNTDSSRIYVFTQITTNINNDVKQVACGFYHTFILKNDGSVWSCGDNEYGQLGLGSSESTAKNKFTQVTTNINNDVKQIACGYNHTVILKNDGSIWSCGDNDYGQLGLNDEFDRSAFNNTNFSTLLSEYDIDRIALYNYLLSNDVEVTEDMDIGTMLDILVGDYINNMILGYENNLRIILTNKGVDVTEEDNMDSLIAKVDDINVGEGLDIISATELPATGKENQICVVTDNPVDNFIITGNSAESNNDKIVIYNSTGTSNYNVIKNNITYSYNISRVRYQANDLSSYYWGNSQWNRLTVGGSIVLFERGEFLNTDITGGFGTDTGTTISGSNFVFSGDRDENLLSTTTKKINFSKFKTLKVTFYTTGSSATFLVGSFTDTYAGKYGTSFSITGKTNDEESISAPTSAKEITIDVSGWTTGYLGFYRSTQNLAPTVYITKIILEA